MNILDLLNKELEYKNWSLEEKARYLYIRSCELFTYDERYDFIVSNIYNKMKKEELENLEIDLENLEDNRIICITYAQIYDKILKELLNIDSKQTGIKHKWLIFDINDQPMIADATVSSDLARVKMKLWTYGYEFFRKNSDCENDFKTIDKKIGYIKNEYENYYIRQKLNELKELDLLSDELYRIKIIKKFIEKYKLDNFTDAQYCMSYLICKFFNGQNDAVELYEESGYKNIKRINIYPFEFDKQKLYYILEKIDSKYCLNEITESDYKQYVKTLDGINKRK